MIKISYTNHLSLGVKWGSLGFSKLNILWELYYIEILLLSPKKKKKRKILVYIRLDAQAVVHKLDILILVYFHIYISN